MKNKNQILEEEAYRNQIRANLQTTKEKPGASFPWMGVFLIPVLLIALIAATLIAVNPAKQLEQADQTAKAAQQSANSMQGTFYALDKSSYNYDIVRDDTQDNYTVTFSPFLPRDDNTLFLAMQEVFKTVYGSDGIDIATRPTIVEKNGVNVLQFTSSSSSYYVLPVKEDTGEIHSVTLWKE